MRGHLPSWMGLGALAMKRTRHRVDQRDYSRLSKTAFRHGRMRRLTALVAGAGALGSEVIKNLASLGVGRLWIVDRDVIEPSNLTRSPFYCGAAVLQECRRRTPKAELAARRVAEVNPDVETWFWQGEVADIGLGRLRRVDLILSCLDNDLARLQLSWMCGRTDRLLVDGGLGRINSSCGMVSLYPGGGGPCFACRKGSEARSRLLAGAFGRSTSCSPVGGEDPIRTSPLMASAVAALQVETGLRRRFEDGGRASEKGHPQEGQALRLMFHPHPLMEELRFERNPDCPLHEGAPVSKQIRVLEERRSDTVTLNELLGLAGPGAALRLDWPLLLRARCRGCGRIWNPMRRRLLALSQGCPNCRSLQIAELCCVDRLEAGSELAARSLSEIGLPTSHIHELTVPSEGESARLYFEMGGDWDSRDPRGTPC